MSNITYSISNFNQPSRNSENIIVSQQKSIIGLQDQVNNLQSEISTINNGLQNIFTLIQNESILEKSKLLEEEKREKELFYSNIRLGKEEELKRGIDKSLSEPVEKLQPQLTSVFGRITSALGLLLFQFLPKGIIRNISRFTKSVIRGFLNIRSFVSKSLNAVGRTIVWLKRGFDKVINSFRNVKQNIVNLVSKLTRSPFKFISNLFKRAIGFLNKGTNSGTASVASGSTRSLATFIKAGAKGAKSIVGGIGRQLLGGSFVAGADILSGEDPKKATVGAGGFLTGAKFGAALGSPLGPIGSFFGSIALGSIGQEISKRGYETIFEDKKIPRSSDTGENIESGNFLNNYNLNINPTEFFGLNKLDTKSEDTNINNINIGLTNNKPDSVNNSNTEKQSINNIETTTIKPQAEIKPSPKNNQLMGDLPEPKPDIIMASTVTQNQNKSRFKANAGTDVPLISSFNSDNFYTLYSQTNYNVVI